VDGKILLHDFKELMNLAKLPGEESRGDHTIGGFVMVTDGLEFELVAMGENRVDKALVRRRQGASPDLHPNKTTTDRELTR